MALAFCFVLLEIVALISLSPNTDTDSTGEILSSDSWHAVTCFVYGMDTVNFAFLYVNLASISLTSLFLSFTVSHSLFTPAGWLAG